MTGARPSGWIDPFADGSWPAQARGCATDRSGAAGLGFDLGGVSDAETVRAHRALLAERLGVAEVRFLRQVHGTAVVELGAGGGGRVPEADAAVTELPGVALAILTADCLPVLFVDRAGTRVGAAHAGWRGLVAGVLEATVAAMGRPPGELHAWLGPAIGQDAFEVGPEVRDAVRAGQGTAATVEQLDAALRPGCGDRWQLDLAAAAATRLEALGVGRIVSSGVDSFAERRFHSHRREAGRAGRQGTLIWLSPHPRSSRG